jgi:hypothetical protein
VIVGQTSKRSKLEMIISESIKKKNRKPNQSKPKTAKTAFDLDEFG